MDEITITEAMAELKTIRKKMEKKRQFVLENLVRQSVIRDPFEKEDSTQKAKVEQEGQAISDLMTRWLRLKSAISAANDATAVTVEGMNKTVSDWLVWRREFSQWQGTFLTTIASAAPGARAEVLKHLGEVPVERRDDRYELEVNYSEIEAHESSERHDAILGGLDGALSLHNARTMITV